MNSFNSNLKSKIKKNKSCLCVGLDISLESIGSKKISTLKEHTFDVIDATRDLAVAYKPNFAFFERWGAAGFAWLEETVEYIGSNHIKIADAKRGDIGNTARQYAQSVFEHFNFDAVTLNPYMGEDGILPFLNVENKGVFILCRTSNPSAIHLQGKLNDTNPIFKKVAIMANKLNDKGNIGLVVGATAIDELRIIKDIAPDLSLLIPGVGAQGGNLEQSVKIGNSTSSALINISRDINFAGNLSQKSIRKSAKNYVNKMKSFLNDK